MPVAQKRIKFQKVTSLGYIEFRKEIYQILNDASFKLKKNNKVCMVFKYSGDQIKPKARQTNAVEPIVESKVSKVNLKMVEKSDGDQAVSKMPLSDNTKIKRSFNDIIDTMIYMRHF